MNRFSHYLISALTILILSSWGGTGHYIISYGASFSFNAEMSQFSNWTNYLADHASDADYRKNDDPNEGPKHYIDIDNYNEFANEEPLPYTFVQAVNRYGYDFVISNGTLPWSTKNTYDSLVLALKDLNIEKAKSFAADLGHYVADGHMPLHLTKNYNGQLTNNYGIHSRYESTMINSYENELKDYQSITISHIDDVQKYVFEYISDNYKYVDSILIADNYARSINSDYNSWEYNNALWLKTKAFTKILFANSSKQFAELIYSAWIDAGRPSFTNTGVYDNEPISFSVYPNPTTGIYNINIYSKINDLISVRVFDLSGKIVSEKRIKCYPNQFINYSDDLRYSNGGYIVNFSGKDFSKNTKIILMKKTDRNQ